MATQKEKTEVQRLLGRTAPKRITITDISAGNTANAIGAVQETAKRNKRLDYAVVVVRK